MNVLVSVIIPAYNAEKYILQCIDSVIKQSYKNLQIIIINDGSTDETEAMCRNYMKIDSRIELYNLPNQGVSIARNYGLEKAQGQWVMFVDADDILIKDAIKIAVEIKKKYASDTVCLNGIYLYDDEKKNMNLFYNEKKENMFLIFDNKCLINHLYCKSKDIYLGDYFRAVWGKLLSLDIIRKNNLKFPKNIKIGEDALFLIDYFYYCNSVAFSNEFVYEYRIEKTSVTGKYKENFVDYQKMEFKSLVLKMSLYKLDYTKAGVSFWHKAEKDLIENELKKDKDIIRIIKTIQPILKEKNILYYLIQFDDDGIKSWIRTMLLRMRLFKVVLYIDVKKQLQKLRV